MVRSSCCELVAEGHEFDGDKVLAEACDTITKDRHVGLKRKAANTGQTQRPNPAAGLAMAKVRFDVTSWKEDPKIYCYYGTRK
jgi:hypothetical protein